MRIQKQLDLLHGLYHPFYSNYQAAVLRWDLLVYESSSSFIVDRSQSHTMTDSRATPASPVESPSSPLESLASPLQAPAPPARLLAARRSSSPATDPRVRAAPLESPASPLESPGSSVEIIASPLAIDPSPLEHPRSPTLSAPETHFCSFCDDEFPYAGATFIDDDPVCSTCVAEAIVPGFRAALESEANYPFSWGGLELNPNDFADFFDDWRTFATAWEVRMREYKMLSKDRLYCRGCETFMGKQTEAKTAHCVKCEMDICAKCGSRDHDRTTCKEDETTDGVEDSTIRQKCPRCERAYYLADGCNHMTCSSCGAEWCWICGEASPGFNHWAEGNPCPRYNRPGSANAHYDQPVEIQPADEIIFNHRIEHELRYPPVIVPAEIWAFEPPEPPEGNKEFLQDLGVLAWQSTHFDQAMDEMRGPLSQRVHDLTLALRMKYAPLDYAHAKLNWYDHCVDLTNDMVLKNRKAMRLCMQQGTALFDLAPIKGVDADIMRDWRNLGMRLYSLYAILESVRSYWMEDGELERTVQNHIDVVNCWQRVKDCEVLKERYGPVFTAATLYLIAAPPRIAILESMRADQRERFLLPPNLDGVEHQRVRDVVANRRMAEALRRARVAGEEVLGNEERDDQ